ncbi:MAG: agmatinase, partial [Desulfurococcaceae archaeon]
GSRFAPQKMREAACNLELYSLWEDFPLEEIGFKDYGDILLPSGDVVKALERIEFVLQNLRQEHNGFIVLLGGEHLVTYPAVRALKDEIDTLVVFDAHLDLRSEYLGSTLNHATFLRKIAEDNINILHIGSRAYSKEELEYANKANIKLIKAREASPHSIDLEELERVYISLDMDVFDPSIAPGVSNPEPFGLSHFAVVSILKEVFSKSSKVVAFDLVELNPLVDYSDITSILAAKFIIEVGGLLLKKGRN